LINSLLTYTIENWLGGTQIHYVILSLLEEENTYLHGVKVFFNNNLVGTYDKQFCVAFQSL